MPSQSKPEPAWKSVADLQTLTSEQLRTEYERVLGKKTTSRNRKQLVATLAKEVQNVKSSPPTPSVLTTTFRRRPTRGMKRSARDGRSRKRTPKTKRATRPVGQPDPRLPQVGSLITKTYKGRKINVKVTESGFEYGGKAFRSLSAIAREVTGAVWNGFLFFGLIPRPAKQEPGQ
ncbi:MAG: DUF2924 domain-containing protein [candidate division Zixibacteria bacterium]|nr:DUF2924 domain-containing protein [candidate division Zixibacteria bacterium]